MEIKAVAAQILKDAKVYLDEIEEEVYSRQLDLLFGASIGQHTRHFIEFFQCLLDQIETQKPVINYALRKRNMAIESDPNFASTLIDNLFARLSDLEHNVVSRLVCSEHFAGNEQVCVDTNLERELLYNVEHTIHHLAIIKIGLAAIAPQIDLPAHFGVAPSTVQYKQGLCAQ